MKRAAKPPFDWLAHVEDLAMKALWVRDHAGESTPAMADKDVRCYVGSLEGTYDHGRVELWRFVVVSYPFTDRDGRDADGTAMNMTRGLVIRLTPEIARKAMKAAEEATHDAG